MKSKKYRGIFLLTIFFILGFAIATLFFYKPTVSFPSTQIVAEETEIIPIVDRNYFEIVVPEIGKAKERIDIAMFQFKFYENEKNKVRLLQEALIAAAARGVRVRVLLDQSNWNSGIKKDNDPTFDYLKANGIQVKFDSPKKTLHSKLLIIDDTVIVGSTNLGFHALERNSEVSVLIRNKETADYYRAYFEDLWN